MVAKARPQPTEPIAISPTVGPEPTGDGAIPKLRQLAQLRDSGVITEAEFQAKKDELLSRI